jgi:hypothetical protein
MLRIHYRKLHYCIGHGALNLLACIDAARSGSTLRGDADKCERRDHHRAPCLNKLILVLLRLSPRLAEIRCTTLLAQLQHMSTHQAGVSKAVSQQERSGDDTKAQNHCVGCLVALVGYDDIARPQLSVCYAIRNEVSETEAN